MQTGQMLADADVIELDAEAASESFFDSERTGLKALCAIALQKGVECSFDGLLARYPRSHDMPPARLADIARKEGLKAGIRLVAAERLPTVSRLAPFIARLSNGAYVVVVRILEKSEKEIGDEPWHSVVVFNPRVPEAKLIEIGHSEWLKHWTGELIFLKRPFRLDDTRRPFGFGSFVTEFWSQRRLLANIVLAAFAMHVLALAVPLFFQVVIDRVLAYTATSTLIVISIGVFIAIAFDAVLSWLRGHFLLYLSSRIDIRLARSTFSHLLALPVTFFERLRSGVIAKNLQQGAQIREFMTGRLLLTLLDLPALLVFLPLMACYSFVLTGIVLAVTALLAATITILTPRYKRKLNKYYVAEGRRQSLLIESLHGIRTIKSLNLEAQRGELWDAASVDTVGTYRRVASMSLAANTFSQLIEKLLTVLTVIVGASLVFSHDLSIGALVAFNMISSRVTGPVLATIGLLQNYQETAMSVTMLGEVMNHPTEDRGSRGLCPPITGNLCLDDVSFTYEGMPKPTLKNLSLNIPAGTMLGIVGRSGSGKSTLGVLLQGLYHVDSGSISVDGYNIQDIDRIYLRSKLGVVPQEPFLFHGTIRENILMGDVHATSEDAVRAARLSGADEFIQSLPKRFDTLIEEGAINLSGGQKQRLAIARALVRQPGIIIFDEATSALDPESETIVTRNLDRISRGRTTIIISHRLRTIRSADLIVVLDEGAIIATGTHDQLISRCALYQNLWMEQAGEIAA